MFRSQTKPLRRITGHYLYQSIPCHFYCKKKILAESCSAASAAMTPFALFPCNRERNVFLRRVPPRALRRQQRAKEQKSLLKSNPQVKLNLSVFTQISHAERKCLKKTNRKKSPRCKCTALFFFLVTFFSFKRKKNYKCFAAFGHWRPH